MEKIANLTTFSYNDNPSIATNKLIKKYFGANVELTYPAILFFQVDCDTIVDSLLIALNEEKIEDSFIELKEYIKKAADTLKKIVDKNKTNYQEIFDCIEREIQSLKNSRKLKRVTKGAGSVIGLISSVKGLF